ncbi:hypothetical protein BS78_K224600 [Paspalum vaginatum]|uniref:Uncharacterized protein n=1 Tax=Paspalum vaginatum TaxID=158149 RepID=A0A9W8CFP4_9POAL|nr:hypothetical protein BS78_K224600 [Paspalum vaginatum]
MDPFCSFPANAPFQFGFFFSIPMDYCSHAKLMRIDKGGILSARLTNLIDNNSRSKQAMITSLIFLG